MEFLPLIHHINDLVRRDLLHPLLNRCKIRCIIQGCPVRFQDHTGRDLLRIILPCHIHHKGTFALMGIAFPLHIFHHAGNPLLYIGFPLPEFKMHLQAVIIFLQIRHGYPHNMIPECAIPPLAVLQLKSRFHRLFFICLIRFGFSACRRVDLLQFGNRKRSLLRIFSGKILIKIRQPGLS